MNNTDYRQLLDIAHQQAIDYIENIDDRSVFPTPKAIANLAHFEEPLGEAGSNAADMLETLHRLGSPGTVGQIRGRYFGFVNGATHPPALAARWLADVWDQNAALYVMSPVASKLEEVCERWFVDLLGLPESTAAGFVSGTTMSLVCGIAAARHELLRRQGWDVNDDGLFGAPPIRVVIGAQAHSAVDKALSFLGLGRNRVEIVPSDDQGRMIAEQVPALDDRTLLVLQAGNVNSGAFDPFEEICQQAAGSGAWIHVDGAFGLWAAASPEIRPLFKGAELADSWSGDAHKTLNAPYDNGIILCKDRDALASALQAGGAYLQFSEHRDNMMYTPELSRRARAVELWALLKTMGRSGVAELVNRLCAHARLFADKLAANDFHIVNDVVFNQVLVACETSDVTKSTLGHIQSSGECWCGGSEWHGEAVIRVSVCSHATTEEDIERSVRAFIAARAAAREQF